MKKLFVLAAFLGFTYVGVNAQTVAPKKAQTATEAPKSTTAPAEVKAVSTNEEAEIKTVSTEKKTEAHCTTSEKKSCAPQGGKKSCCSSKKQTSAPAPTPNQ